MFVGRLDELDTIERALFQSKNGNPQHFLVQGERGIGKSSLFTFVEAIADGRLKGALAGVLSAPNKFLCCVDKRHPRRESQERCQGGRGLSGLIVLQVFRSISFH